MKRKNVLRNQKGFTLIEIIAVLVILGILAAVAIPKFMGLQQDARISSMKGLMGSMQGAASLVYAKSAIGGATGATGTVAYDGTNTMTVRYGYPTNIAELQKGMSSVSGYDVYGEGLAVSGAPNKANCSVSYAPPTTANGSPAIAMGGTANCD
jgi:MSHA pilin protein MshA